MPIHSATFTGIRPEVVLLCVQDSADTLVCDIAAETIATLGAGAPACPVTLQSAAHCSSDSYSGTAGSHIFSLSQSVSSDSTVRYAVSKWVVVDSALSVVATSEELLYPTAASGDVTNVTDSGCPHVNSLFTSFSPRVLLLHLTPAGGRSAKSDADSTNSQTDMSQGAWDTVLLLSKDTLAVVSRVSLFDLLSDSCMSRLGYRPNFSATSECSYHHVSCIRDITATVSSSLTLKVVPACSSSSVGGSAGGDSSVGAGAVESARLCAYMETTTTSVTTSYPLISMISDASAAAAAASVNSPPGPLTSPPMSPKALPLSAESNPVVPTTSHLGGTIRAEEEKLPVAERKEDSESMEVSSPPLSPIAAPTAGTDMVFPSRLGADVPLSTAVKVVREHHCFLFDAFVDGDGCSPVSQVAPVEGVAPVAVGDACRFENIIKLKCFTDLMATLRPLKGKGRECGAPVNLVPCPDPQRDRMLLLVLCSAGGTKGSEGGGNGVGKLLCCEDRITRSDFSGPSYPVGFTLIDKVQPYIETESELDTVVVKVTPGAAAAGVGGQGKRGQKRFARSSRHSERAPLGQVVIDLFNPAPKSACTHANKVLDVLPFDLRVFQSAKGVDKTAPDGTAAAAVASSGEQMATGTSESTYRGRGAEIRADGAENGCSSGTDHPNNPGRIMPLNFFFPLSSKFLQYKRSAEELLVTDAAHMASVDAATGGGGTGAVAADDAGVSADLTVGMDMGGVVAEGAEAGSGLGTDTAAASVLMKPTNYGALVHRCATSAEHVSSAMLKLQQEIVENKLKMAERLDKLKLAKVCYPLWLLLLLLRLFCSAQLWAVMLMLAYRVSVHYFHFAWCCMRGIALFCRS